MPSARRNPRVVLVASWGLLLVTLLLMRAVVSLTPLALEPWLHRQMTGFQIALYIGWLFFNAYAEGYRAFQLKFSPRVVGRAVHLGHHPRPLHVVLALFDCMRLYHASRRQLIARWGFVVALVALIIGVHQLSQPWRGIVDGGVVVGLAWGVAAIWWIFARYLLGHPAPVVTDLPQSEAAALGASLAA